MGLRGLPGVCLLSLLTLQVVAAQGSPTGGPRGGKVCGTPLGQNLAAEPGREPRDGGCPHPPRLPLNGEDPLAHWGGEAGVLRTQATSHSHPLTDRPWCPERLHSHLALVLFYRSDWLWMQ